MLRASILSAILFLNSLSYSQVDSALTRDHFAMEYLFKYVLVKPADSIFVERREPSRRIRTKFCSKSNVVFLDTLKSGNVYRIELSSRPFNSVGRSFALDSSVVVYEKGRKRFPIGKIDGFEAYGVAPGLDLPRTELVISSVEINSKRIYVSKEASGGLYVPNFCSKDNSVEYVEAYESTDKKYLYLYMAGSDAGGAYMVKWIFSRDRYITRLVTIFECGGFDILDGLIDKDCY